MIDFIGRLTKNPVKNGVKETDPVSLLRDVTADGDAASVCSPIMTGYPICEKYFLYGHLK